MTDCTIPYETTPEIRQIISKIGRTEDLKFSPDYKRFAVTELFEKSVHIFSIETDRKSSPTGIFITGHSLVKSSKFNKPHGVTFLDNNHIVVCNRTGDVSILGIPPADDQTGVHHSGPFETLSGKGYFFAKVKSPGSVDSYPIADNCYRILVCNNYWHVITSHVVEIGNSIKIKNEGVLIEKSLKIPDGITVSPDRKWIAVSNHVNGVVLVYENNSDLSRKSPPVVSLKGPVCPHGLRFTPDGKRLVVADAASPYILIYEYGNGSWSEVQKSCKSIRVLKDDLFYRGRYGAKEGGLKGIDVDKSSSLLVTTHKDQVLAFYDLKKLIDMEDEADTEEIMDFVHQRDKSFDELGELLSRKWNLISRVKKFGESAFLQILLLLKNNRYNLKLKYLEYRNKNSKDSLLDISGPVLSITTHGDRLEKVFYTIESIGDGYKKPSRIILWICDKEKLMAPPESLLRLKTRGLEICFSEDYGPHTKYYPYVKDEKNFNKPLVTADDDVTYPKSWLRNLLNAYKGDQSVIHCYSARRMDLCKIYFAPYSEWEICSDTCPSHVNFIISVSGVIYPPEFLKYLKLKGDSFSSCCPKADDIWITVNALRSGFKIAQIDKEPAHYRNIPGTQKQKLLDYNVSLGGNQIQLDDTFSREDIFKLEKCIRSEK